MVLCQKHLSEVTHSNPVQKAFACSGQELHAVSTGAQTLDASVQLALEQGLAEVLVDMEEHYLPVSTSYTDLVVCNRCNLLDTLRTHRLREDEHLILHLI